MSGITLSVLRNDFDQFVEFPDQANYHPERHQFKQKNQKQLDATRAQNFLGNLKTVLAERFIGINVDEYSQNAEGIAALKQKLVTDFPDLKIRFGKNPFTQKDLKVGEQDISCRAVEALQAERDARATAAAKAQRNAELAGLPRQYTAQRSAELLALRQQAAARLRVAEQRANKVEEESEVRADLFDPSAEEIQWQQAEALRLQQARQAQAAAQALAAKTARIATLRVQREQLLSNLRTVTQQAGSNMRIVTETKKSTFKQVDAIDLELISLGVRP